MPFSIAITQGEQFLKLEGAVTIRNAQDLAAQLGEGLDDGVSVTVDTTNLADVDTCVLQLLCSLRKTVTALSFDDPSEAFLIALDRCGLRRELLGTREAL